MNFKNFLNSFKLESKEKIIEAVQGLLGLLHSKLKKILYNWTRPIFGNVSIFFSV